MGPWTWFRRSLYRISGRKVKHEWWRFEQTSQSRFPKLTVRNGRKEGTITSWHFVTFPWTRCSVSRTRSLGALVGLNHPNTRHETWLHFFSFVIYDSLFLLFFFFPFFLKHVRLCSHIHKHTHIHKYWQERTLHLLLLLIQSLRD